MNSIIDFAKNYRAPQQDQQDAGRSVQTAQQQGAPSQQLQSYAQSFAQNPLSNIVGALSNPTVWPSANQSSTTKFNRTGMQASQTGQQENPEFGSSDFSPSTMKSAPTLNILRALANPNTYNPQLKALLAAQGGLFNSNQ
jgi:hypothetical protein